MTIQQLNHSAVRDAYLKWRGGVGGVRQVSVAEPEKKVTPGTTLFAPTDAYDQPIDDVRRVAVCLSKHRA